MSNDPNKHQNELAAKLAADGRLELLKTVARAALRVKEIQAKEAAARAGD